MGPPFLQMTRRDLLRFFGAAGGLAAAGNLTGCAEALARQDAIAVDGWQKSVCRFCGTGCEMAVGVQQGRVVKVEGLQGGWNRGRLCVKGLMNRDILYVSDRALHPMIRHNGRLVQATWDDALDAAAEGFKRAIAEGGPKAVGFYGSGQLLTQESYTANKLFKAGIGTNNVEGNPRLCMASAVAGYISTFGQDEPMGVYDDINHATLMFITGANMMEAHPVCSGRWSRTARRSTRRWRSSWSIRGARPPPGWRTCTCRSAPAPTWRSTTRCATSSSAPV
jgi:anaerobic selenocysteine-containing dehydrogenase